MKISIQGNQGSYSHIAAEHLFGEDIELLERDTFKECFEDCHDKRSDYSVIPIENSTHGSVYQNYDLLTQNNLHIVKELYLKINFNLIVIPGTKFEEITDLYTHPVSISQIQKFLEANSQIQAHTYVDNGAAVNYIKETNKPSSSAAASKLAAKIFGMEVVRENIQDNPMNYTRFFVVSTKEKFDKNSNKTSIQFEVEHKVGTLVKTLEVFSRNGISLSKIESRPINNTLWEYMFYADFMAGLNDPKLQSSLENIKAHTKNVRILGTYLEGEYIDT